MNEQPSKSSRRNHSSNRSKIASRRSSGVAPRRRASACDPVEGPALLALCEERHDEVVLGREVVVERRFRDARVRDHLVDPHGANTARGEEAVGGFDQSFSRHRQVCTGTRQRRRPNGPEIKI